MSKILVVDDEVDLEMLIKQKFRQKIREHQYEFVFAANGNDALEKLQQHPDIDIILCDINMPEMDGLTLLSRLKELSPIIKTVIVSAYGDMENIRTAMNRGAFDFVTKPVNFDDLELTVQKTIQYVSQLRETMKAIKENNILRMYVDEAVLNFMGSREFETSLMLNETVEASVAFIDICSFTTISENESPDTVVKLLNNFFDVMVKEIIAQGGYIDKFIGDAIMAVFRGDFHRPVRGLPGSQRPPPRCREGRHRSGVAVSGDDGDDWRRRAGAPGQPDAAAGLLELEPGRREARDHRDARGGRDVGGVLVSRP